MKYEHANNVTGHTLCLFCSFVEMAKRMSILKSDVNAPPPQKVGRFLGHTTFQSLWGVSHFIRWEEACCKEAHTVSQYSRPTHRACVFLNHRIVSQHPWVSTFSWCLKMSACSGQVILPPHSEHGHYIGRCTFEGAGSLRVSQLSHSERTALILTRAICVRVFL